MTSMGKRYGTHSIDYQFYHYLKTGMKEKASVFEMLQCANLGSFIHIQINCAIIPREGSDLDESEVLRFCKKNLATFKVPKKVFMTDTLPKTATGKIQRRLVAEHFLAQISTAKIPKFGA